MIIKFYLEYNTYSDIQIKIRYSPTAIKHYIQDFGRVFLSYKRDLSIEETARVVSLSEKLVKEYFELYLKYNSNEYQERIADIVDKTRKKTPVNAGIKKGGFKMSKSSFDNLDRKTFRKAVIELLESEYKLVGSHK